MYWIDIEGGKRRTALEGEKAENLYNKPLPEAAADLGDFHEWSSFCGYYGMRKIGSLCWKASWMVSSLQSGGAKFVASNLFRVFAYMHHTECTMMRTVQLQLQGNWRSTGMCIWCWDLRQNVIKKTCCHTQSQWLNQTRPRQNFRCEISQTQLSNRCLLESCTSV